MNRAIATVAALPLVLAACAGGRGLTTPYTDKEPVPAHYIGIQTASITCTPEDAKILGLGSFLATLGAEFVANLGKELLEDMQKSRSAAYAATGLMQTQCLPQGGGEVSGTLRVLRAAKDQSGDIIQHPAFDLEAKVDLLRIASDPKSLKLQLTVTPTRFSYGQAAPRGGSKRKRVIVMLQISDKTELGAGEADGEVKLSAPIRIDLGEVQEGGTYESKENPPSNMLEHTASSVVLPFPVGKNPVVTALVVETEDESLALRAFSSAYDTKRDDLVALIVDALKRDNDDDDDGGDV